MYVPGLDAASEEGQHCPVEAVIPAVGPDDLKEGGEIGVKSTTVFLTVHGC